MALVKIGKAAELLGVEAQTLRKWEETSGLIPDRRSQGGTRYYDVGKIMGLGNEDMPTIGYARVCGHDQKNDLVRQQELLEAFCAAKGWRHEVIADLGSGLSYRKIRAQSPSRTDPAQAHPTPGADPQGSAAALRLGTDLCVV
jgi:putative resolvase